MNDYKHFTRRVNKDEYVLNDKFTDSMFISKFFKTFDDYYMNTNDKHNILMVANDNGKIMLMYDNDKYEYVIDGDIDKFNSLVTKYKNDVHTWNEAWTFMCENFLTKK